MSEMNETEIELREEFRKLTPTVQRAVGPTEDIYVAEMMARFAEAAAREASELIAPDGNLSLSQARLAFAPVPTDQCRVSPFFPMSKNEMASREYIKKMIITSNAWGTIYYTGGKLSTYEEDILYAVLSLLSKSENQDVVEFEGQKTYRYRGPLRPILRQIGYSKTGQTNYQRVLDALDLMTATLIKMEINARSSRGKKKIKKTSSMNMVSFSDYDHEKEELTVIINPFYYEYYLAGSCTLIDMGIRSKITPISKCLHRFVMSHQSNLWHGNMFTLARSLNLNLDLPTAELRKRLRASINELIKVGVLSTDSLIDGDIVVLTRRARPQAALAVKTKKKKSA